MRTLTTIRDAEQLVSDWTERYTIQPTREQIHSAARALVAHVGGYGADASPEATEGFDLDTALDVDVGTG